MHKMTTRLLLASALVIAAGTASGQPAPLSDSDLDRVVAGLDGSGNGNGNGNLGDFNGNANSGNANGNGNIGNFNGNGNPTDLNGNATIGNFQGNNVAGASASPAANGLGPVSSPTDGPALSAGPAAPTGDNLGAALSPGLAGPRIDTPALSPDALHGAVLPLSLGWVPSLPQP